MATGNQDPIGTRFEGRHDHILTHPAGTGHLDNPDIGWILEAADACQVRSGITAPVTQESDNLRFPVIRFAHSYLFVYWSDSSFLHLFIT
jgi:hypothetical protein